MNVHIHSEKKALSIQKRIKHNSHELILADGNCKAIRDLLSQATRPCHTLINNIDPISKIGEILQSFRDRNNPIEILHIVAHGKPGAVLLGSKWVDTATLTQQSETISLWRISAINLWCCETGADPEFTSVLEDLSGARVYSSKQKIGFGNKSTWKLKAHASAYQLQEIAPFTEASIKSWTHQLGTVFDANSRQLSFNTKTGIRGDGTKIQDIIRFDNVISIDGQQVDAVVTTTAVGDGTTIREYDSTLTPIRDNGVYLQPTIYSAINTLGRFRLTIDFFIGGTYTSPGTGTKATLQNVLVNSYDIDGSQYQAFKGFVTYEVPVNTELTTTVTKDGLVQFTAPASLDTSGTEDAGRVRVYYDSISSFDIEIGDYNGNQAVYALDFSLGPKWSGPTKIIETPAPSITYSTTNLGEAIANNGSIAETVTLYLSKAIFSGVNGQAIKGTSFYNVPDGLTAEVNRVSETQAILHFKGKAFSHAEIDSINDFGISFSDESFADGIPATAVTSATRSDIGIIFLDGTDVALSNPHVNEASPYVVFSVALTSGQNISLSLIDGSAIGGQSFPSILTRRRLHLDQLLN
jgi:hypothetical protein